MLQAGLIYIYISKLKVHERPSTGSFDRERECAGQKHMINFYKKSKYLIKPVLTSKYKWMGRVGDVVYIKQVHFLLL